MFFWITNVVYARWYIFVTVVSLLFIGVQYDQREEMSAWYLDLSLGIIAIIYGFLLYKSQEGYNQEISNLKAMDERTIYLYVEIIYVFFLYLYLRKNYKKETLTYDMRYLVAIEAIVMCNITLMCQGTASFSNLYQGQDNITEEVKIANQINEVDKSYFRLFSTTSDRDGNNLAMIYGTRE